MYVYVEIYMTAALSYTEMKYQSEMPDDQDDFKVPLSLTRLQISSCL